MAQIRDSLTRDWPLSQPQAETIVESIVKQGLLRDYFSQYEQAYQSGNPDNFGIPNITSGSGGTIRLKPTKTAQPLKNPFEQNTGGIESKKSQIWASKFSTFMDIHPLDVARQLTLIEFSIYRNIPTHEFMNCSWNNKETQYIRSANLMKLINRANMVRNG